MRTFRTVEEMLKFVSDDANIETLDSGEITLKDWIELGNSIEKHKRDYASATKDKKTLREQKEKLDKHVAELTEQLETVNTELAGLKDVHTGGDKEAIQKLNKEKSELTAKYNASESKLRELEKQVAVIPDLEKQVEGYRAASNRSRVLDAVRKAAVQRNVPQHILDDADIMRIVADDFTIDESGGIFTTGDTPQSVDNYIAAKQKEKPHWNPVSMGGSGADPIKVVSDGGTISDEQGAIIRMLQASVP